MTPPTPAELREIAHEQLELIEKERLHCIIPDAVFERELQIIAQACERWAEQLEAEEAMSTKSSQLAKTSTNLIP